MQIEYLKKESSYFRISLTNNAKEEIGHAYLFLIQNDLHQEPYGFMEDVFIEEKFRGQGYGKQLVDALIQKAKDSSCYKLLGTSRNSREKVHQFYEKLGFTWWGKEFRLNLKE